MVAVAYVAPIVEGQGEVEAVAALLHRIAGAMAYLGRLRVNPPIRIKAGSFLEDDEYFHKYVTLAAAKAAAQAGCVVILLDCEDDCPAELGPRLLAKARAVRSDVAVLVVLAYREYETWFMTAARSLRGRRGLPADLNPPSDPEATRDAKGWLGRRMNTAYDPVTHQLEFTRAFDLDLAQANPSFARFYYLICRFLTGSLGQ